MTSRCRDFPKKGASNTFRTNKKGPKKIWEHKIKIIHVANVFNNRKDKLIMVPKQWLLMAHDKRKGV